MSQITDSTWQPVGEVRDGRERQAIVEVEVMGELDRSFGEHLVERDLPNALPYRSCVHHRASVIEGFPVLLTVPALSPKKQ